MNEETNFLFSVVRDSEGSAVHLHTESSEDIFAIALGIHQAIHGCPKIALFLAAIAQMAQDDEFKDALDENTIEMPDFDEILKNTK